jgi:hypothetical protein
VAAEAVAVATAVLFRMAAPSLAAWVVLVYVASDVLLLAGLVTSLPMPVVVTIR